MLNSIKLADNIRITTSTDQEQIQTTVKELLHVYFKQREQYNEVGEQLVIIIDNIADIYNCEVTLEKLDTDTGEYIKQLTRYQV